MPTRLNCIDLTGDRPKPITIWRPQLKRKAAELGLRNRELRNLLDKEACARIEEHDPTVVKKARTPASKIPAAVDTDARSGSEIPAAVETDASSGSEIPAVVKESPDSHDLSSGDADTGKDAEVAGFTSHGAVNVIGMDDRGRTPSSSFRPVSPPYGPTTPPAVYGPNVLPPPTTPPAVYGPNGSPEYRPKSPWYLPEEVSDEFLNEIQGIILTVEWILRQPEISREELVNVFSRLKIYFRKVTAKYFGV